MLAYAKDVTVGPIAAQVRLVAPMAVVLIYFLIQVIAVSAVKPAQEHKLVVPVYVSTLTPMLIVAAAALAKETIAPSKDMKLQDVVLEHALI